MSLAVSKTVDLSPAVLSSLTPESNEDGSFQEYPTLGGVLSNTDYAWLANGPNLEIIKTSNSRIVGAWSFNLANNAEIVCVEEVQKINKRPPLLAVCLDCGNNGSMICIFDFITSKVIRAIEVPEIITSLHVIDSGNDIFTLPSPLRAFDGILTIGTAGGPVYLIDICRQVCDDGLTLNGLADIRDESNPCKLLTITSKDIDKIELHKESAVRHNDHLAIYLNATFDNKTQHFLLKGPEGGNRTYVDAKEAAVSALFYCPQLGSLLVGYNFGAFQVYNLVDLTLIYTSPVCEEHIPITHFTIQEPADDPRAYCYIWAVYSAGRDFQACFPLAVMYTFCYQTKEYHEGYGFLYQDFNYASIQFQMELTSCNGENRREKPQGGRCLRLNTIQRGNFLRDTPNNDSVDDNLSLSIFIWNVIYNKRDSDVCVCIFDLNQWYKEQLPSIPDPNFSSTYMIQFCVSDLFNSSLSLDQDYSTLDVSIIEKSLKQFKGIQKLEEYFCPNSLSYDLVALRENSVVFLQNKGVQKSLLAHIESSGPLCLIDPAETYQQIIGLGLLPLFIDLPTNIPISTNQRREIILSTALEHYLRGWLCKCASEWASGNFLSAGCSLDFLISWAFQRASVLKTNCDKFCVPLFDYSQTKLDSNTTKLLNSCTRQLRNLTNFYVFVIEKLYKFISNPQLVQEQYKSLEAIVVYLEVVLCFLNIGLLPECPIVSYPQIDDFQRINVPYPAEMLIDAYNERRGFLKIENEKVYSSSNSPLFIDNLIDSEYGSQILQGYWRDDGGNGLYPPLSIQALLRIYLIEDADIVFKHTVVSYLLLDLVTILDQDRYKHIASYLIKFPTVFKLSLSKIKIIQALWQLDHGDCNAALGLLFDSLVKKEDLNEWHHKMVLRLLILQNQHKLALLYLQVKNPIIKDKEDICAIISLYVANDMLDEAFYFEQRYSGQVGKKLFIRLLEEADKNDKLKLIIRRNLNQEQETLLLDYLTKSPKPYANDLRIYYYIINSRHFEAFNLYNSSVTNQVDCQGLSGQLSANPQDQIIIHLKRLFPDITQKIFDYCYEHKDDVVEKETKPTPVSAFVYNAQENAKYKSNFIGAVIAKTRTTFNESVLNKKFVTETIPFIRTSIISKTNARDSVPVIDPKIIKVDNFIDSLSESAPPNKRLKLSKSSSPFSTTLSMSRLETPIVQRKLFKTPESIEKSDLPHSILKKLTPNESSIKREDSKVLNSTPLSSLRKRKSLGSPYKSLERPSPSVRFQGLKNLSPIDESQSSSKELDNSGTTGESSKSPTVQKFYSPDVSFNDNEIGANSSENMDIKNEETIKSPVFLSPKTRKSAPLRSTSSSKRLSDVSDSFDLNFNSSSGSTKITLSTSFLESVNSPVQDTKPVQDSSEGSSKIVSSNINVDETSLSPRKDSPRILPNLRPRAPLQSPSGSSSKRLSDVSDSFELNLNSSSDSTKITLSRSSLEPVDSPIHNKKLVQDSPQGSSKIVSSKHSLNLQSNINVDEKNLSPRKDSPRILPNLRPRKSLCRKVLEHNIASRVLTSPRRRLSKRIEKEECSELKNIIQESHLESSRKFNDGREIQKSNLIEKYSIATKTMVEETDEEDMSIHEIDISGTSVGLSDSFKRSLIDSKIISSEIDENVSVCKNETEQASQDKNTISKTENQQHSKLSESVLKNNEEIQNQASIIEKMEETAEVSRISLGDSKTFLEETDDSIVIKNDTTFGLTDSLKEILNDSSSSGKESEESKNPSISENRTNVPTDNETNTIIILDDTQKESKSYPDSSNNVDDMMEVDDYNIDDAVPQTTDNKTSNDDVKDDDDDDVKLIYDDLSQTSQTKQINVDETEKNNDDDINIEEIILKADNQSSLVQENDPDETPSVLERNVLDDDSSEDNEELNVDPKSGKKQIEEPEVIEILSSSEEDGSVNEEETEESSSEDSSSNDDGDHDENLDVVFERNINESSSVSSVSSANSITSSEEEEENDDTKEKEKESENRGIEKKRQSYGLFHGPIETIEEKTVQESIINLDETQKLEKTGEVEDKKSTINETQAIVVEEIEKNKKTDSTMEQSHETDIDKTVCTDENIGKRIEENKSVIEFKNQQLDSETEAKESSRSESHLEEEEELEIGKSKEIDKKKRQSYGLFHGPIVDTTIHEENIPELQDTSIRENPVVDRTISEERQLELNDTVIKENENRPNTDCTDENIGKSSLEENKSVVEFKKQQLEHSEIEAKESNRRESHLEEEELEIGESKEIDKKKRQSYGLFHGPIVDTTIHEENIHELQDTSIKENPVVDTTISEERQLELNDTVIKENENCRNIEKEEEKSSVIEEQIISKDKEIEENEETVRIRRQSHGLFHGIITDKTICEESDNSAIDQSKNQLTDTQIEEETSQEDYKKRQSYGLFHGSINETITEDRDCLTKLDISAIESIENKAIETESTNIIDLPSTSQFERSEIPSTSNVENKFVENQRRTRRAASEDIDQAKIQRSIRTRSSSFHSEGHQESYNNDLDNTLSKSLRSRTILIDEENNKSNQRKRSTSIDEKKDNEPLKKAKKSSKKHTSILQLPEIIEEEDEDNHTKRIKETLENYSMSRRITRRQASLLQSIDPVVVLNKLPLDETLKQIEDLSSDNTELKPKRRLRSDSQNSNTSVHSDTKVSSTTGTKMRLRSSSTDAIEGTSISSKYNKKTKSETSDDLIEIESGTRTRSRTNSESSTASSASTTSKVTRKKVKISKLPEIKEEDNKETATAAKRVTRKRSNQK